MASISTDPQGNRTIQFVAGDGKRRSVRLGKMSIKTAGKIKTYVEAINAALIANTSLETESAKWLAGLCDDLHAKLAAVGLVAPRQTALLDEFLHKFIDNRKATLKPNTIVNLLAAKKRLVEYFAADRDMRTITTIDADAWAAALAERYAPITAGRLIKRARQFYDAALRHKVVLENPFKHLKASSHANKDRQFHVDRETIARVLDAAPDAEWRLIIALSRFGGLRCPSEHLALRWQDIDWARQRFLVRSSKTEHHEDGGERWVPIFPELLPYLQESFELAEEGAVYVINRYRDTNANLRTTFAKIIKRAGVKPWPKLFHNLRASRQTELVVDSPIHVVCAWMGNSPRVASKHYLTLREEDYQRAANSGAVVVQNAVQQPSALPGKTSQESTQEEVFCEVVPTNATIGETSHYPRQDSNLHKPA